MYILRQGTWYIIVYMIYSSKYKAILKKVWPLVWLCCAKYLLCYPQLTCLEIRPDFLSSGSPFSFHSEHMCLKDFLESATRLRILELPHCLTGVVGEFVLDFGRHINHHVGHQELMLQGNLLYRIHLHIHKSCLGTFILDIQCILLATELHK